MLGVLLAGSALVTVGWTGSARGDSLEGTRFDVREKVHAVAARLDRGAASFVVTRVVQNPGPKSDQAVFHLDLPGGAVATRLRTAASGPRGEPIWFEGELMEAEEAARKYRELTGIGGFYPKDPALLSWRAQGLLALQVFPVPAGASKTVEYTLRLPMTYEGGRYRITVPQLGTETMPARMKFSAAYGEDRVEVNGVTVGADATVMASRDLDVQLVPKGAPMLDGALASFGFGSDRVLVHGRVAAAPRLSEAPTNAAVVVLVDTSRSMESDLPSALAAARAYVSQLPSAHVEVMAFSRTVASPFGGPLPAREAMSRLAAWSPPLGNGSALDDALLQADTKLARSRESVRRILVLTDLRTRETLTPERFAARPPASDAVVHVTRV
jgi:VWA domain-containing protein/vault protein inter-alpha-trypsin-like protein